MTSSSSINSIKRELVHQRELGNLDEESRICREIGERYMDQEKFHLALKYHLCDLEISESISDFPGICASLGNISNISVFLRMFDSAHERQLRRLEIAKSNSIPEQELLSYVGMGWLFHSWSLALEEFYVDFGYLEQAKEFYELALKFSMENSFELAHILEAKHGLAIVLSDLGDKENAQFILESIANDLESSSCMEQDFLYKVWKDLAVFHYESNEYNKAIELQYKFLISAQKNSWVVVNLSGKKESLINLSIYFKFFLPASPPPPQWLVFIK